MKIPFTKLQGAKNDFPITPAAEVPITDLQEFAIAICNRNTDMGADGWTILDRTEGPGYDATIRLFNSDGSEPGISIPTVVGGTTPAFPAIGLLS
jgi:diaminopimelate epimerase